MQAVGRLGSYISRSVYTVSGPFHPFGGAVDIIVVEQPDGSYKSSPWYVRFGKFQGVLKSKEKVVNISVNGVDADFHMYLDHKGEAFFLREVDGEESGSAISPPSSSGEDVEGRSGRWPLKSKSCNFDSNWSDTIVDERKVVTRTNSRRSQLMGLVFGRRSASEEGIQMKEDPSGVARSESLELAEFTADLLDLKWSTNLDSPKSKGKNQNASLDASKDGFNEKKSVAGSNQDETGVTSQENSKEPENTSEENDVETKHSTSEYIVKTTTTVESVREDITLSSSEPLITRTGKSDFHVSSVSVVSEVAKSDPLIQDSSEKLKSYPEIQQCLDKEDKFSFVHEEKTLVSEGVTETIVTECYSQLVCVHKSNGPLRNCSSREGQPSFGENDKHETSDGPLCSSDPQCTQAPKNAEEELLLFGDLDGVDSRDAKSLEQTHSDQEGKEANDLVPSRACGGPSDASDAKCDSSHSFDSSNIKDYLNDAGVQRTKLCSVSSDACINEMGDDQSKGLTRMARSLPTFGPLSNNLEAGDLGKSPFPPMYPGVRSDADKKRQSSGARTTTGDATNLKESKLEPDNTPLRSPGSTDSLGGSGSNWSFPFGRSRSTEVSQADMNGGENQKKVIQNNSDDLESGPDVKVIKKKVRTLTPTSEQLASLNLKEGKNIVIFTFSTSMLGQQQVDARIFLWNWDARIVISDVDGTITRSDLLGQVMPLVGMDWSQTGVAHLFSAIKENGYQFIFLSARSISQSFITRQFLLSIKQDGIALPDGPIVISPDGLFPSLFREVVRRAPHEFKIACLEDIKALFPPDRNPFYAGFGNRDTDEFSYLKVGIPKGKIFIINPKGEIAVNRRVDTKSYLALHNLVHGMFPTMSSCEQEDFNSWNYWKIPPPMIDL